MKNKKVLIALSCIAIAACMGVGAFAYYKTTATTQTVKATTAVSTEEVIDVASFESLYLNGKDTSYNDASVTSSVRKIMRLSADVTLLDDYVITKDVHFDLNGYTLNLNDHVLTIEHGYAGCFSLYGGTIDTGTNSKGSVVIDLPNATYNTSDLTFTDNGTAGNSCIKIASLDERYTEYTAFYMIGQALASDLDKNVAYLDYSTVNAKDESDAYTMDLTASSNYVQSKRVCSYGSANEVCSFIYKDIDLPYHYLSSDITITYASSDATVFSNFGNVTVPSAESNVTLTATVSLGTTWTASCAYKLHVVNLSNATVGQNVGKTLIQAYLSDYYKAADSKVATEYYDFNHGIELPESILDGSITLAYSLLNSSDAAVRTYSSEGNGVYNLKPNDNCAYLNINVTSNGSTSPLKVAVYSTFVSNEETIARLILNNVYGGSIIFDPAYSTKTLASRTDILNTANTEYDDIRSLITDYDVQSITYAVKASSTAASYYTLSGYTLGLLASAEGTPPTKSPSVTATFQFGTGDAAVSVDIDLYVTYLTGTGNTLNSFINYYSKYNTQVSTVLTTSYDESAHKLVYSFTMPFYYDVNSTPFTCYEVATNCNKTLMDTSADADVEDFKYYHSSISVEFKNSKGWSNVYAYMWNSATNANNATWPGEAISLLGSSTDVYQAIVDTSKYDYIIFNDGTSTNQTEDLPLTSATTGFEISGDASPYACTAGLDSVVGNAVYGVTYSKPASLKVTLYYNGADRVTFSYASSSSFSDQLDAYITSSGDSLATIASYEDTVYKFSIDAQNALTEDVSVLIIYKYKLNAKDSSWSTYQYTYNDVDYLTESTTSSFTLKSGVFFNASSTASNAIKNANFYTWIFNNFKPTESISMTVSGTTYTINDPDASDSITGSLSNIMIPMDWLAQDIALDYTTDSTLSSVTDFSGIGNLSKVTTVNLSGFGSNMTSSIIASIATLPSVTTLKLSNCNLTSVSDLTDLDTVKILYVDNNAISEFEDLTEMDSLEFVYLYGNTSSNSNSTYYGSEGIVNYQAFYDLIREGVTVYNTVSEGVAMPFADSDSMNNYTRLKSIIYQDKLAAGTDITELYTMFTGLTVSNFGLTKYNAAEVKASSTPSNATIIDTGSLAWSYGGGTDATDATYFMVTHTMANGVKVTVKFYVDRYTA